MRSRARDFLTGSIQNVNPRTGTHTHTHITAAIREAIDAAVQAAPGATSKRKRVEVKID